jgi:hypothetical protein
LDPPVTTICTSTNDIEALYNMSSPFFKQYSGQVLTRYYERQTDSQTDGQTDRKYKNKIPWKRADIMASQNLLCKVLYQDKIKHCRRDWDLNKISTLSSPGLE